MVNQIAQGMVRHRRYVDCAHQFSYSLYMMHLDLATIEEAFTGYRACAYNRFNYLHFRRRDYLKHPELNLLAAAQSTVLEATGATVDRVHLLTHLACLGYAFNPISLYCCFTGDALTHCIVAVTNTPWGKTHEYVLPVEQMGNNRYRMIFRKALRVSPFLTMNYQYVLRLKYQVDRIILHIENQQEGVRHFDATLSLSTTPMTPQALRKTLWKHPFMTGKVIAAIYWQAFQLWRKGAPFIGHRGE
jgi:DUF1365 family protein